MWKFKLHRLPKSHAFLSGTSAMRCCDGFFMGNSLSDSKDLLIPFIGTNLEALLSGLPRNSPQFLEALMHIWSSIVRSRASSRKQALVRVRGSTRASFQRDHLQLQLLRLRQCVITSPAVDICCSTTRDASFSSVMMTNRCDSVPAAPPEPPTKLFNGPTA